MKYVVFCRQAEQIARYFAVVFSRSQTHSEIAAGVMRRQEARDFEPVSAGFCHYSDGSWVVYGKSESLRLDSNKELDPLVLGHMTSDLQYTVYDPHKP